MASVSCPEDHFSVDVTNKIHGYFQIAKLQDDNRALDRLTKQKEAALLEAERTVQIALAKAAMVDDMQNKNQELMKQIEICQVSGGLWKIYKVFILEDNH
jgi:hypothetical protein